VVVKAKSMRMVASSVMTVIVDCIDEIEKRVRKKGEMAFSKYSPSFAWTSPQPCAGQGS